MKTARDKFISAMETYLVSMGYKRVQGKGEKSKWEVPKNRGSYTGSILFLDNAVEIEFTGSSPAVELADY